MPHLILRHSSNLQKNDFKSFFIKAHELISRILNVRISSCSSFVISHEQYVLGDGDDKDKVFIHLDVHIKPGNDSKYLQTTGKHLLELLQTYVVNQGLDSTIKISVCLSEVSPYFYS